MNGHNPRISIDKFSWIALFATLVFPVICLDYILYRTKIGAVYYTLWSIYIFLEQHYFPLAFCFSNGQILV